jgi:HD domain
MTNPTVTTEALKLSAKAVLTDIAFFARMAPDDKTRNLLLNAIETMPLPAPMALQLTTARDTRPDVYSHLIRTALTAAWLSRTPLMSRFDVQMAAAAGMLHDIGMLHVDTLLLLPEHVLNRDQRRQLYSHPLMSVTLIEPHLQYPKEVVRAIREHHECLDGSGYPRNLAGDAISPLGKILSLSKVVAAMFAPGRVAPELRLSVLLRMNTHRYDNTMALQIIGLLRHEPDAAAAGLALLDNPMKQLLAIDHALGQWPAGLSTRPELPPVRRDEIARLGSHVSQIQRALANVGAAPDQLAQLGSDALDISLQQEMTLLTREAGWQLRTLARQTRRRWQAEPGEMFPDALQVWLDSVDTVVAGITGVETSVDN